MDFLSRGSASLQCPASASAIARWETGWGCALFTELFPGAWPADAEADPSNAAQIKNARTRFTPRLYIQPPVQKLSHLNRDRGSSHLFAPPTPPDRRVRIGRFSKLSPYGPEVRVVVRHKGFATLQVSVSALPSSEPVKLSRS